MISSQRRASPASTATAKDRLLTATTELLSNEGPQGATSRAIAEASGENLGAITYYFGSKDRLISESFATTARQLLEPVIGELTDPEIDPASKLMSTVQMLQRILEHNRNKLPGYLQSLAAATKDETLRNEIQRLHRELTALLATEIARQQQAGTLPTWVSPDPMAKLIVAVANGVAVAAAIDPDQTDTAAIGAQLAQLLLAARTQPSQT